MVVIISLLGVGAGMAYSANLERSYTSSAVVLLNPVPASPLTPEAASGSGAQLTVALETEAEVVTTPSIAEGVSTRLGRLVPNDEEILDVQVPAGTQMVQISFTSTSPAGASDGAQTFAEVYLEYRQERAAGSAESSLITLRAESEEIEEGLQRALGDAEEGDSLASREVDLLMDRLAVVNGRISTEEATSTDPGHVLQPAREPASSNEPDDALILAAVGVLALGFGALLALYREWQTDVVSETSDPEVAGVPVFATVPLTSSVLARRATAAHEGYRQLRAGVVANGPRPYTLAVGSVGANRLASEVASNLALVLAEAGFSVLLVGADPDDQRIDELVGTDSNSSGLSDIISDNAAIEPALLYYRGLTVLPGGGTPSSAQELYAGPRFQHLLDDLRGRYDYVILATAPAGSADGDAVTSVAGSALLVLTAGSSTRAQVAAALERYDRLGVRAMGAVTLSGDRVRERSVPQEKLPDSVPQDTGFHVPV